MEVGSITGDGRLCSEHGGLICFYLQSTRLKADPGGISAHAWGIRRTRAQMLISGTGWRIGAWIEAVSKSVGRQLPFPRPFPLFPVPPFPLLPLPALPRPDPPLPPLALPPSAGVPVDPPAVVSLLLEEGLGAGLDDVDDAPPGDDAPAVADPTAAICWLMFANCVCSAAPTFAIAARAPNEIAPVRSAYSIRSCARVSRRNRCSSLNTVASRVCIGPLAAPRYRHFDVVAERRAATIRPGGTRTTTAVEAA